MHCPNVAGRQLSEASNGQDYLAVTVEENHGSDYGARQYACQRGADPCAGADLPWVDRHVSTTAILTPARATEVRRFQDVDKSIQIQQTKVLTIRDISA
jgi:hypothetical protein